MLDALRPFLIAENLVPGAENPGGAAAAAAAPVGTDVLKALARKWRLGRPEFWRSVAGSRLRLARALLETALERAAMPALPASVASGRAEAVSAGNSAVAAGKGAALAGFGSVGLGKRAHGEVPLLAKPMGQAGKALAAAAGSATTDASHAAAPAAPAALAEHGKRAKAGLLSRHLAAIDVASLIAEAKQQPKQQQRAARGRNRSESLPRRCYRASTFGPAESGLVEVTWWDAEATAQAGFAPGAAAGAPSGPAASPALPAGRVSSAGEAGASAATRPSARSDNDNGASDDGSSGGASVVVRSGSQAKVPAAHAAASSRPSPIRPAGVPALAVRPAAEATLAGAGAAAADADPVVAGGSNTSSVASSPVPSAREQPQPQPQPAAAHAKGPSHRRSQSLPTANPRGAMTMAAAAALAGGGGAAPGPAAAARQSVAGRGHTRASTHAHIAGPSLAFEPQPAPAEMVLQKSLRQSCADAVRELARRPANRAAILAEEGALESLVAVMHDSDSFDTKMAVAVTLASLSSVQAPLASQLALLEGPHVAAALDAAAAAAAAVAAKSTATATASSAGVAGEAAHPGTAAGVGVGAGGGSGGSPRKGGSPSRSPRPLSAMAAVPHAAGTGLRLAAPDAGSMEGRPATAGSPTLAGISAAGAGAGVSAAGFGSSATLRRRGISLSLALNGGSGGGGGQASLGRAAITSADSPGGGATSSPRRGQSCSPSGAGAASAASRALAQAAGHRGGPGHSQAQTAAAVAVHEGFDLPPSVLPALADLAHRVCSADAAAHAANAALNALGGSAAAHAAAATSAHSHGAAAAAASSSIDAVLTRHATAWVDPLGRASLRCVVATTLYNLTCDKRLVRRFAGDATAVDALLTLMEPGSPALLAAAMDEAREAAALAAALPPLPAGTASSIASHGHGSPLGPGGGRPSLRSPLARMSAVPSPLSPGTTAAFASGAGAAGNAGASGSPISAAGAPTTTTGSDAPPRLTPAVLAELDAVISADAYVMSLCVRALANVAAAPSASVTAAAAAAGASTAGAPDGGEAAPSVGREQAQPQPSPSAASGGGSGGIGAGAALLQQAGVARALAGVFNWLSPALRVVVAAHVLEPMTRSPAAAQQLAADGGVVLLRAAMRCLYEAHLKRQQQRKAHRQARSPATSDHAVAAAETAAHASSADRSDADAGLAIDAEAASASLDALDDTELQWSCRRILMALARMAVTRQGIVKVLRGLGTVALAEGVEMVLDASDGDDSHDACDSTNGFEAAVATGAAAAGAAAATAATGPQQPAFASVAASAYIHVRQLVRGSGSGSSTHGSSSAQTQMAPPDVALLFHAAELRPSGLPASWADEARAAVLAATAAVATGGNAHTAHVLSLPLAAGAATLERGASFSGGVPAAPAAAEGFATTTALAAGGASMASPSARAAAGTPAGAAAVMAAVVSSEQAAMAAQPAEASQGSTGQPSQSSTPGLTGPCSLSRARVLRAVADALQRLLSSPKASLAAAGGAAGAAAMMLCDATAGTRDAILAKSCLHCLVLAFHIPECAEYAAFDGAALAALHFAGFLARLQLAALSSDGRTATATPAEAAAAAMLPHSPATAAGLLALQPLAMLALFNATAHVSVAQRLMAAPGQVVGAVSGEGHNLTRLIPSLARRIRVRGGALRLPTGLGDSGGASTDRDGVAAAGTHAIHALLTSGGPTAAGAPIAASLTDAAGSATASSASPREVVNAAEASIAAGRSSLSALTEGQLQTDPYGSDAALSTAAALMAVAEGRSAGAAGASAAVSTILAVLALGVSQLREAQRHSEVALQQQMDAFARVQAITAAAASNSGGSASEAIGTAASSPSLLSSGAGVGVHVNGSSVALQPQMPAGLVAALGLLPSGSPAPGLHSHLYRLVAFALCKSPCSRAVFRRAVQ